MSTTRVLHFVVPSPADVGQRCVASIDVVNGIRDVMLDGLDVGPERRRLIAEQLRGIVVDLALASGYLTGAVSE